MKMTLPDFGTNMLVSKNSWRFRNCSHVLSSKGTIVLEVGHIFLTSIIYTSRCCILDKIKTCGIFLDTELSECSTKNLDIQK